MSPAGISLMSLLEIISKRPSKVDGFRKILCSNLEEVSSSPQWRDCNENGYCFRLTCVNCVLFLAFGEKQNCSNVLLVPQIEPVPHYLQLIGQYYDPISEFYWKFLAPLQNLTGILIQDFMHYDAAKIFYSPILNFSSFAGKESFKIDWIYLSGATITVIHVRGYNFTTPQRTRPSFDQMNHNCKVLRQILEATNCRNVTVNYLLALMNASFPEDKRIQLFLDFYNDIQRQIMWGGTFGLISKECLQKGTVYMFNTIKNQFEEKCFYEVSGSFNNPTCWSDNYKNLTALLVLSKTLDAEEMEDSDEHARFIPAIDVPDSSQHCEPSEDTTGEVETRFKVEDSEEERVAWAPNGNSGEFGSSVESQNGNEHFEVEESQESLNEEDQTQSPVQQMILLSASALEIASSLPHFAEGMSILMFEVVAKKKTGYKSVDFLLFLQILRVNFENEEVERFASVLCQAIKNKNFDGIINALLVHFWIRFHFTLEDEKPQMSDVMIIIWEKLEETVLKKTLLSQLKKYAPNLLVSCVAMVYENFFLKCYPNHLWCRKLYNISQPWHPTFSCLSILLLNCFFHILLLDLACVFMDKV